MKDTKTASDMLLLILFLASRSLLANPFQQCHGSDLFQGQTEDRETAWSGPRAALEAISKNCYESNGFDSETHLGRNLCQLVPATHAEMERELQRGNPDGWSENWRISSMYHGWENVKYTTPTTETGDRREVVYNRKTGKIETSTQMGTRNFAENYHNPLPYSDHRKLDMAPHSEEGGNQYKYVGILYETDPSDPGKYFIVDGQTGERLTPSQVRDMPATMSDMWKDMGLIETRDSQRILGDEELARRSWENANQVPAHELPVADNAENVIDEPSFLDGLKDIVLDEFKDIFSTDVLAKVAELLETGEDITEAREKNREKRSDKKERERIEQEQHDVEEVKEDAPKKVTPKKKTTPTTTQPKKKTTPTTTKPKKTTTTTTQPKKKTTTTACVDTSKLDAAAKRQISYLRDLIAAGKKASRDQAETYNSYAKATVTEINALNAKLDSMNLSTAERQRIVSQVQSKVSSYNSTLNSLKSAAVANGILTAR